MSVQTKGILKTYFETGDKPIQQQFANFIESNYGLLGVKTGFNFNSIADQTITLSGGTTYIPMDCIIRNVSVPLNTATNFGINDQALQAGNQIFKFVTGDSGIEDLRFIAPALGYLSMKDLYNKCIAKNLVGSINTGIAQYEVGATLYASVEVAEGVAATGDLYIYGIVIT